MIRFVVGEYLACEAIWSDEMLEGAIDIARYASSLH